MSSRTEEEDELVAARSSSAAALKSVLTARHPDILKVLSRNDEIETLVDYDYSINVREYFFIISSWHNIIRWLWKAVR